MGGEESEHLRRLEERLGQLTQLLIDAGERLTEERARSDAQRLTLLRLIDLLAVNGRLDLEELRAALSLAVSLRQAPPIQRRGLVRGLGTGEGNGAGVVGGASAWDCARASASSL